ncbi:helix-turn-helix transcriptional regulator [Dongshaea marina]|uniref:helix-turn-helix transcriptional regulator n=1 Tax=Dongshaea marina TaxID=2047966 RepID=UPI000D3EA1A8
MSYRFVRRPETLKMLGLSNTVLYGRINDGLVPPPVSLGGRSVAWVSTELDAVMAAMVNGSNPDELRNLVRELVERRQELVA